MRTGDRVIVRRAYRQSGKPGGWRWDEHPGEIVTFSKHFKSAMVHFQTKYGNWMYERFPMDRIRKAEK